MCVIKTGESVCLCVCVCGGRVCLTQLPRHVFAMYLWVLHCITGALVSVGPAEALFWPHCSMSQGLSLHCCFL